MQTVTKVVMVSTVRRHVVIAVVCVTELTAGAQGLAASNSRQLHSSNSHLISPPRFKTHIPFDIGIFL